MPTVTSESTHTGDDGPLLLADGFEEAFVGVGRRCSRPDVAVYDVDAMMRVIIERDGASYIEALEYLEFNVLGAWVGERTPIYLSRREPVDYLPLNDKSLEEIDT